uniref:Carbonic anhydrase n=1 Tax=Panagrolaimus sp. JU765 TaxID=591449 RepID=A0AC34QN35_9BILA
MIFILFLTSFFKSVIGEAPLYRGDNPFSSWPQLCQIGQLQINGFPYWANPPYMVNGGFNGKYNLQQMHFHWSSTDFAGSEHTVDGRHYAMEIHMVHFKEIPSNQFKSILEEPEGIAVVGILMTLTDVSRAFWALEPALPNVVTFNSSIEIASFSPNDFFPQNTDAFYRYSGSLTTPGCNENVVWTVFTNPGNISTKQLSMFRRIQDSTNAAHDFNFRPTQPLNGRTVFLRDPRGTSPNSNLSIFFFFVAIFTHF